MKQSIWQMIHKTLLIGSMKVAMQKFSTEYFNSIRSGDEVTAIIFGNKRGLKGTAIKPAQIQYPPFLRWLVEFEDGTTGTFESRYLVFWEDWLEYKGRIL